MIQLAHITPRPLSGILVHQCRLLVVCGALFSDQGGPFHLAGEFRIISGPMRNSLDRHGPYGLCRFFKTMKNCRVTRSGAYTGSENTLIDNVAVCGIPRTSELSIRLRTHIAYGFTRFAYQMPKISLDRTYRECVR